MNRIKGWILITFTSLLLTVFAVAIFIIVRSSIIHPGKSIDLNGLTIPAIGLVLISYLLILGLVNGLKMVKKEKKRQITEYKKSIEIKLSGKIEFNDYRNLLIRNSYKLSHLSIIGVLFILLTFANLNNSFNNPTMLIILLGIILFSPLLTHYQAQRIYRVNKIFQEKLNYLITNESIHIKGETVDSELKWNHFFKLKDTKNFFMFFHGENVATLLDKKMFSSENINEFYDFINSLDLKIEK